MRTPRHKLLGLLLVAGTLLALRATPALGCGSRLSARQMPCCGAMRDRTDGGRPTPARPAPCCRVERAPDSATPAAGKFRVPEPPVEPGLAVSCPQLPALVPFESAASPEVHARGPAPPGHAPLRI